MTVVKPCECGCGQPAPIAKNTDSRRGSVKGQPNRFVQGHSCRRHGHAGNRQTKTYAFWQNMLQRCNRPRHPEYPNYGGRGIKVCDLWSPKAGGSFENFLSDMGEKPESLTLDRRNNDGNYEPSNCWWADKRSQQRNRRNTVLVLINGKGQTVNEWATETGINRTTLDTPSSGLES
jgi:hypothetical protein